MDSTSGWSTNEQSAAVAYVAEAEKAARRGPWASAGQAMRPVRSAAVIGAGTMGAGICMCFVDAGIPVTLVEASKEALDRGMTRIQEYYGRQAARGRIDATTAEKSMALVSPTLSIEAIATADLVIEAVFEEMSIKERVFRHMDGLAAPGAILATNTSMLDLNRIAGCTNRPQDVVGLHFFSPANLMRLVEVVQGDATATDVVATAMELAVTLHKTPVLSGVCDGFIGNRMMDQYVRQAHLLLEEGCAVKQVDDAMEAFGFRMGPFRMLDIAGNDIGWAIRKRRAVERPEIRYSRFPDLLCERGRFGQKTRAGYYDYPGDLRNAVPSREVSELLERCRAESGLGARHVAADEIVRRLVWSLVNEGARLLQEGIAQQASDIDVVLVSGYAFPGGKGGPMYYADRTGLAAVVRQMHEFARNPRDDAGFWQPAPLLARRVAEGGSLLSYTRHPA